MKNDWLLMIGSFVAMVVFVYGAIFYSWKLALLGIVVILLFAYLFSYPVHGIAASVFLAGLGVLSFFQAGPIHIKAYQLVMLLTLAGALAKYFAERGSLFLPRSAIFVLSLLLLSIMLSFLNAPYPAVFVKQFLLLSVYVLLFITIFSTVRTERHLYLIEKTIVFSGAVGCLYSFLTIMHVVPAVGGASFYHFTRPQSFFAEPNEFGVFLVFVAGFAVSRFLAAENTKQKMWTGVVLTMIIALIIPNMSRGSWVGLLMSVGITMLLLHALKLRTFNVLRLGLFTVGIAGLILISAHSMSKLIPSRSPLKVKEIVFERAGSLFQKKDPTRDIRLRSNITAIEEFWEHPFVGWGLGNSFVILEKKYKHKEGDYQEIPKIIAGTSSNFITDVAMETGVFGLLGFAIFIVWTLRTCQRTMLAVKEKKIAVFYIGALASFIGLLTNGLTYAMHMLPYFWIAAGMLVVEVKGE